MDVSWHGDGGERYGDGGNNVPKAEEEHDQMISGHGKGRETLSTKSVNIRIVLFIIFAI